MGGKQTAKFAGTLVTHQDFFSRILSRRDMQWVIQNPQEAIKLMSVAIKEQSVIYTRPFPDGHELILPPNYGTQTIAQVIDMFGDIDSKFENWCFDVPSTTTIETSVTVREMIKDGNFKTIFGELGDISRLCLTQGQIIDFVRLHKKCLRKGGSGTFFLFRKDDEFFVADMTLRFDGLIDVEVYQFLLDDVWDSRCRLRFVLPQLTP